MKKITAIVLLICLITFCVIAQAFKHKENQGKRISKSIFTAPKNFPEVVYDIKNNPVTQSGFELGRKLFYDGRLSKNGNFPCASCHQQFAAFSNYDHPFSHGIDNGQTLRNAPALFNLAWQRNYMWDGSVTQLEHQFIIPITAKNEMGETIENVLKKLNNDADYKKLFKKTFGSANITFDRVQKALNQFLIMLISNNSKYDRVMNGKDSFSIPEKAGYTIFKNKCASCHKEPLFTDNSFRNTGMPLDTFIKDYGRMKFTQKVKDSLLFRVPSLRNVQVSPPYGHDGRFYSLNAAIQHYNNKVINASTDHSIKNLYLNNYEIGQLKAFLYTLTDTVLLNEKKFKELNYNDRVELH